MKRYLLVMVMVILTGTVFAQGAGDALRYSQTYYMGTARFMATGGSFGALGADLSLASTNPAGLGLFRLNKFSITPMFNTSNTQSVYNGVTATDSKFDMSLGNLGYVRATKINNNSGWKYLQLAVGMNKLNDFHANLNMQGPNATNSRLDVYLQNADGINYNDIANNKNNAYSYYLQPAWDLYLIDTIPGYNNLYYSPVPYGGTYQSDQHVVTGSVNQWYVSAAANYNNVVYIGATLGINSLNYNRDSYYSETDIADTIPYFNSWELDQSLQTIGTGIDLKLGIIVQANKWLRLGVAFHTPTWYYSMTDTWQTKTYANLGWVSPSSVKSPIGTYNYSLTTPMKFIGDIGILIGNRGSVSLEYENINYSTMRLNAPDYNFKTENNNIKNYYKSTNNLRLGTEWRFGLMDVRAGYAYYGSPYSNGYNDGSRVSISGGLGFHLSNYTIDMAYVHSVQKQDYYFYGTNNISVNPVNNTFKNNRFAISISYRF